MFEVPVKNYYTDIPLTGGHIWHKLMDKRSIEVEAKKAFIDAHTDRSITRAEARNMSERLAYGLRNVVGLEAGQTVLLWSANSYLYPIALLGIAAADLVATTANPTYTDGEILFQLKTSSSKVLVVSPELYKRAMAAAKAVSIPLNRVYVLESDEKIPEAPSVWSLMSDNRLQPRQLSLEESQKVVFLLVFSSGTTGRPKGVQITHYNMTSILDQAKAIEPEIYTSDERFVAFLPLYHMYGLFTFCMEPPYLGSSVVIMRAFNLEELLFLIQKHKATAAHIVPPVALAIAKAPSVTKNDLSSLRFWRCGAAPIGPAVAAAVYERTGTPLCGGYGMTETSCVISSTLSTGTKLNSTGRLIPNLQGKVVDGELYLKGPNVTIGYFNDPEANALAFTEDGWMKTGDIVKVDDDGELYITDRSKELIKYKGFQVAPAELEDHLNSHDSVLDAAVVPFIDGNLEELPRAYVVLKPGTDKSNIISELHSLINDRVASYKQLRGGIIVIDEIPKTSSGKILRRQLRDLAATEVKVRTKL